MTGTPSVDFALFEAVQAMAPFLLPSLAALSVASLFVLLGNSFQGEKKIAFQASLFGTSFVVAVAYLITSETAPLEAFWGAFTALAPRVRFAISLLVIAASYFGAALYVASPKGNGGSSQESSSLLLDTPASCDSAVDFVLPSSLPAEDAVLFEQALDK